MTIGALLGAMLEESLPSFVKRSDVRPHADVDWAEKIRIGLLAVGVSAPFYRFLRGHEAASTWFALAGGALVMYALILMHRMLKGPSPREGNSMESNGERPRST